MTRLAMLFAALIVAAPAAAQPKSEPAAKDAPQAPNAKLESLLENCDAHKFETTVDTVVEGKPHRAKVKMCGKDGQSDADWIGTLDDAIAKLDSNKDMDPAVRDQIVTAVKAEIVRLKGQAPEAVSAAPALTPRTDSSPAPLSNDYSMLPPLPAPLPSARPQATTAPATTIATTSAAPAIASPPIVAKAPPAVNPRLGFSCMSADYPGGGECITLSRDTILTVKATAPVPAGVSLRFVRNGQERAQVAVGAMGKGQSQRLQIPQQVCSGVSTAEVQMEVLSSGQLVDRKGPFLLHC